MTYELVYAALLLGGLLTSRNPKARRQIYGLSLVGLFLFAGFRYEVGCDWGGYQYIFENLHYSTLDSALLQREPAFAALNVLVHTLRLEYPYVNVISSGIYFIGFHAMARRQPDRLGLLILSFPILILNMPMSGIRQGIAIGFLCMAFNAFIDRRVLRYVVLVGCASSFHASALSFLLLAPLIRGELNWKTIALTCLLALPGGYFMLTGDTFSLYLDRYANLGVDAIGAPFRTGLLFVTAVAFLSFLNKKWSYLWPRSHKLTFIGAILMIATFPIAMMSSVVGDRLGYFLNPVQLSILTSLPFLFKGANAALISSAPYIVGAMTLLVWSQFSAVFNECYVPYAIWW